MIARQNDGDMADAVDALFAESPFGIARLDTGGAMVGCNAVLARILDYQPSTLRGRAFADAFAAEDRDDVRAQLAKLVMGTARRITMDNLRLAGSDGTGTRAVQLFGTIIEGGAGELRGLLVHVLEITDRYHQEVRFAHAQRLQALGQLAGSIAHDFNNLIAAILGSCELLLNEMQPRSGGYDELAGIRATALRARSLVRQLLTFARRQPLRPIPLRLDRTIDDLLPLLRRLLGDAILIEVQHDPPLPLTRMDSGRFEQVIINLAVNARDAMPAGGRLSLRTAGLSLRASSRFANDVLPAGNYVQVEVIDTGAGIPKEIIGEIFAPFFTTKAAGGGTGLGLATVDGIVRQSGGHVEVESALGRGTTFRILLPAAEPAAPAAPTPVPADLAAGPAGALSPPTLGEAGRRRPQGTVLVVEDETGVRRFAARALRGQGWMVREAADGEGALQVLAGEGIDLLLTDLKLPDIPGTAVIERARHVRPEMPVMVISGELAAEEVPEPAGGGRLSVLAKPFTLAELVEQVQRLLAE